MFDYAFNLFVDASLAALLLVALSAVFILPLGLILVTAVDGHLLSQFTASLGFMGCYMFLAEGRRDAKLQPHAAWR